MSIYLYLKQHNITGLKYLGQTTKDPIKYTGSGKYWLNHLNKHGYDVTTTILYESDNMEEIREQGLYYSDLWNIVESKEYANLIPEGGEGGGYMMGEANPMFGKTGDKHHAFGTTHSDETRKKISEARKGVATWTGLSHSEESKKKISENRKGKNSGSDHHYHGIKGEDHPSYGYKSSDLQKQRSREVRQRDYIIITPTGETLEVTNLTQFAKDHNLDQGNLTKVAKGLARQSKGYRVIYK